MAGTLVSLLSEQHAEAIETLVRNIADAVGAASCRLALIDPRSKQLVVAAAFGDQRDEAGAEESDTSITVALNHEGHSLGMLTAEPRAGIDPGDFRENVDWVSDIAAQTVQILEELAGERDNRVLLESFNEVARALVATSNEPAALMTMLDQLWRVIRYDAGVVALLDDGVLDVAMARGAKPGNRVIMSEVGGLEAALGSRKPVPLERPHGVLPAFGLPAVDAAVLAPLIAKELTVSAFVLAFRKKDDVGERQTKLLRRFAEHAGLFVDAERLLHRERSARGRAAALARVSRIVAMKAERSELMQTATEQMLEFSGADRAILYTGHPRNAILIPKAVAGVEPREEERAFGLRLNLEDENLAPLVQDQAPVLLEQWEGMKNATPFAKDHVAAAGPHGLARRAHGRLRAREARDAETLRRHPDRASALRCATVHPGSRERAPALGAGQDGDD